MKTRRWGGPVGGFGIPGEILRFALVGTAGFITEATLLMLLVRVVGWGPYESRPVSFFGAVSLTWILNRLFTFARRAGCDRRREYLRYLAVGAFGALINFTVYAAVLLRIPALEQWPLFALAAGSLAAMTFNFLGSRTFAFDGGGRRRAGTPAPPLPMLTGLGASGGIGCAAPRLDA